MYTIIKRTKKKQKPKSNDIELELNTRFMRYKNTMANTYRAQQPEPIFCPVINSVCESLAHLYL